MLPRTMIGMHYQMAMDLELQKLQAGRFHDMLSLGLCKMFITWPRAVGASEQSDR